MNWQTDTVRLDAPREMVLGDLVEPWVWAYHGHVLPNGSVVNFPRQTMPMWHSNDTRWHGL